MRITEKYVFFWGDEDIYSNFYPAKFSHHGVNFNCSEQCFMYCKAKFFKDDKTAQKILNEKIPLKQKHLGRDVTPFDKQVWDEKCMRYMFIACTLKFSLNPELKRQLLETGDRIIVEASPYDTIWGIGLGEDDLRVLDPTKWRGKNLLGQVLMSVRERLRKELEQEYVASSVEP